MKKLSITLLALIIIATIFLMAQQPKEVDAPDTGQNVDTELTEEGETINEEEKASVIAQYEALMKEGAEAYIVDDFETALQKYNEGQELLPNNFLAYYNAGNAEKNLGLYAEAEASLLKARTLEPEHLPIYAALEDMYRIFLAAPEKMIAIYDDAIEKYPENEAFPEAKKNFEELVEKYSS